MDTPELRAAKRAAGIEKCPSTRAATDTAIGGDGGLPELTLECFGGGPSVDLARLRGPLVLSGWGVWCPPCREEAPHLRAYHQQYGDQVPILGVDVKDVQPDEVMDFVTEIGSTYPQLSDPDGAVLGRDGLPASLPFLVLVDAEGRVVHRQVVEIESSDELREIVVEHLGASALAKEPAR